MDLCFAPNRCVTGKLSPTGKSSVSPHPPRERVDCTSLHYDLARLSVLDFIYVILERRAFMAGVGVLVSSSNDLFAVRCSQSQYHPVPVLDFQGYPRSLQYAFCNRDPDTLKCRGHRPPSVCEFYVYRWHCLHSQYRFRPNILVLESNRTSNRLHLQERSSQVFQGGQESSLGQRDRGAARSANINTDPPTIRQN